MSLFITFFFKVVHVYLYVVNVHSTCYLLVCVVPDERKFLWQSAFNIKHNEFRFTIPHTTHIQI
jgi:hypothetical protein